jgi:hypothetical protein
VLEKHGDESRRKLSATVSITQEFYQEYKMMLTPLRRKKTSVAMTTMMMMAMMICLCPRGRGKLTDVFWSYDYYAYATKDDDTDEEIDREMRRSKDGKAAELEGGRGIRRKTRGVSSDFE